jgi:hypothetical protein
VSTNGESVTEVRLTNVPGNTCVFTSVTLTGPFPISEQHLFTANVDGSTVSGAFSVAQQVFGSFSLLDSGCRTGTFSWNAETTATPPPPPSPAPKCHVPKVVGLATARTRVRKAHCAVGRIRYARSATRPPGA